MQDYTNAETVIYESLASYRMKFLQLLNEGGSEYDLKNCQSAIQYCLSELSLVQKATAKRIMQTRREERSAGNIALFLRSVFGRPATLAKAH